MALAMNPVFRSANLIRRTVSHFLCRPHAQFVHVLRPNQSMKVLRFSLSSSLTSKGGGAVRWKAVRSLLA